MNDAVRQFRNFFVSLKLTVVLLALSIILIFAATIDQVNLGVWAVQEKYFRSFFVLARAGNIPIPVFPGGYFVGGLLLARVDGLSPVEYLDETDVTAVRAVARALLAEPPHTIADLLDAGRTSLGRVSW